MSFTMYHATPMSNVLDILQHGLEPRPMPHHKPTLWSPEVKVIYLTNSIITAKDYADQAYMMRKTNAKAWGILKIEYDEFPDEVYTDLDWGIPGVYYVKRWIEPEHITFEHRYFVDPLIRRVKKKKISNPSTEIYFYSEQTEAEFKRYPYLVDFVITTIKSVGKKNNVVIPHIQFCSVEELGKYSEEPALLWLEDPGIGISTMIIDWWKTDKETAQQALAFILAHEVGHYVYHFVFSDEQRNKYIAKYGSYSADEAHADKIAEEYSGLERSEAEGAIEHIFDQMRDEK